MAQLPADGWAWGAPVHILASSSLSRQLDPDPSPSPHPPPYTPTQTAEAAGAGWESWMRAAWRRWNRTKGAAEDSWDSVRDQAYRWAKERPDSGPSPRLLPALLPQPSALLLLQPCMRLCSRCSSLPHCCSLNHASCPLSHVPFTPPQGLRHRCLLLQGDLGHGQGQGAPELGGHKGQDGGGEGAPRVMHLAWHSARHGTAWVSTAQRSK